MIFFTGVITRWIFIFIIIMHWPRWNEDFNIEKCWIYIFFPIFHHVTIEKPFIKLHWNLWGSTYKYLLHTTSRATQVAFQGLCYRQLNFLFSKNYNIQGLKIVEKSSLRQSGANTWQCFRYTNQRHRWYFFILFSLYWVRVITITITPGRRET